MTKIQNESLLEIPINSLFFNCPGRLSYLAACCLFPCILNTDAECSLNDIATTSTHHNAVCNSMAYIKGVLSLSFILYGVEEIILLLDPMQINAKSFL